LCRDLWVDLPEISTSTESNISLTLPDCVTSIVWMDISSIVITGRGFYLRSPQPETLSKCWIMRADVFIRPMKSAEKAPAGEE
jgi:hypothetical protein